MHPVISVYKVRGQQYAYHGQVINFPQDVEGFASRLPHNPRHLSSILIVRRGSGEKYSDITVYRKKVYNALQWLRANNPFCEDVIIDRANLDSFPENGNVFDLLHVVADVQADEVDPDPDSKDLNEVVRHSGVPIPPKLGQHEVIENHFKDFLEDRLHRPEADSIAINEFTDEGYIAKAFPALFPRGTADFRNRRNVSVSPTEYFQHLMNYHDQRFAKDPRFRSFCFELHHGMASNIPGKHLCAKKQKAAKRISDRNARNAEKRSIFCTTNYVLRKHAPWH